jgi:hypothetical protein
MKRKGNREHGDFPLLPAVDGLYVVLGQVHLPEWIIRVRSERAQLLEGLRVPRQL